MIGKTISHYRIIEKLGGRGMGVVYKAEGQRFITMELVAGQTLKYRIGVGADPSVRPPVGEWELHWDRPVYQTAATNEF